MRLGSRRSKFFSFVLGVIKDLLIQGYILQGSKQKVTKLVPSIQKWWKIWRCPNVGPLSCLKSRKVFIEVLVKIYFHVKYSTAD